MINLVIIFLGVFITLIQSCGSPNLDELEVNSKPITLFLDSIQIGNQPHLKISDNAIGENFLFYGTFIPMLNSPTGHSLKGRIIRFEKFPGRVVMLESPMGHAMANKEKSIILLAEFPIVKTTTEGTIIDFAKGMKNAFTARNVHSLGASSSAQTTSNQFRAIPLSASFIREIISQHNVLTISQIAQWKNQKTELVSAEFRYFLRHYDPDPNFTKKTFGKNRWVRYFSTPPQLTETSTKKTAYITKWDITKPIIFHISSNTPKKYKQAITEGLLFWNHIFNQEIIQVKDLDTNLSAPHPTLNIIQWVSWDNEASAYADMIVDHLTGQTLQGQIYLRSGWVIKSAKTLRNRLQELLLSESPEDSSEALEEDVPLPDIFDTNPLCFKNLRSFAAVSDLAEGVLSHQINPEMLQILSNDILRTVVAHELGHVLGLRHQLAGSLNSNLTTLDTETYLKNYLQSGQPVLGANNFITKSIMDVFSAPIDALIGSQIREFINSPLDSSPLRKIFTYDAQAIKYGYFDTPMLGNIPFCSDRDIKLYVDCRRWDTGSTPLLQQSARIKSTLGKVSLVLAETFIESMSPDRKGGPLRLSDIPLTNIGALKAFNNHFSNLFKFFDKNSRSVLTEASYDAFGPHNQEKITQARFGHLREQLEQLGLHHTIFPILPPHTIATLTPESLTLNFEKHFDRLIIHKQQQFSQFSISAEEREKALNIAKNFIQEMLDKLIIIYAQAIAKARFDDPEYQIPLEEALGESAKEIVLSRDQKDSFLTPDILPIFSYDLPTRNAAAYLLAPGIGLLPDWSLESQKNIINDLKLLMRTHAGAQAQNNTVDLSGLAREKRQWLLEQNRIMSTLRKVGQLVRPINQLIIPNSTQK